MKLGTFQNSTPKKKKTAEEWKLIPEGDYVAKLKQYTLKDTKDGTGKYIDARFEVTVDGKPMLAFQKFHVLNKNPKAQQVSMNQLNFLARAVGLKLGIEDTNDLEQVVGKEFIAKVIIRKSNNPDYRDSNEIHRYSAK
jgi:hypothetical protein